MSVTIDGSAGVTTNAGGSVNPSTTIDGINYSCRAWVNFNGTGTVAIRASGNVTSITDNGVGDYTVNFTTAMSDANYSVGGVIKYNTSTTVGTDIRFEIRSATALTASAFRIVTSNYTGGTADVDTAMLNVFR